MATYPQFVKTPNLGANLTNARISAANTGRDGTGTVYSLVTGGTNGTRIDRVNIKATSTTVAGQIVFYILDANAHYRVIHEITVTAVATVDATHASFEVEWARTDGFPLVLLPSGWQLIVSTTIAQTFDVVAECSGDY